MSFQNDDFDAESYVKVNVRLQQFWAKYPEGRVETHWSTCDNKLTVQAKLYRKQEDHSPASTGHAYLEDLTGEKVGEYTETVAVGRALALMGFSVEKSIASSEEMSKFAKRQEGRGNGRTSAPRESKIRPAAAKADAKPAEAPKQDAAPAAQAAPQAEKEEASGAQVPKTLKTSRIFKPLSRQTANEGVSNG